MNQSLYVAYGTGGLLKVGRSGNPSKRCEELRRMFIGKGSSLVMFESFDAIGNARAAEALLIGSAAGRLSPHSGEEWFYCREFDNAVRAAREITDYAKENSDKRSVCEFDGSHPLLEFISILNAIDFQAFWKKSRIPLTTLSRIKSGSHKPTKGTMALLAADLKRINPPKKDPS